MKDKIFNLSEKKILVFIILHIIIIINSFTGVLSKFASEEGFLSLRFIMLYGGIVLILGFYAIVWQQILKYIPLTTAFCNKAVSIIWGIVWGFLIFSEAVTWNMLVGAAVVIVGVIIVVKSDDDLTANVKDSEEIANER